MSRCWWGSRCAIVPSAPTPTVEVTVQLEALVVRADDGSVVATVLSRTYFGQREEPLDPPIVDLDDDPTIAALAAVAANDSATAVFDAVATALGSR
jgi:hypothetical protein